MRGPAVLVAALLACTGCDPSTSDDAERTPSSVATDEGSPGSIAAVSPPTTPGRPDAGDDLAGRGSHVEELAYAEMVPRMPAETIADDVPATIEAGRRGRVAVVGLGDLELDETTWRQDGHVATVTGTVDGIEYRVRLVEHDGLWRVSRITEEVVASVARTATDGPLTR